MNNQIYFGLPAADEALQKWLSLDVWYEHHGPGHQPFYRLVGEYLRANTGGGIEDFWTVLSRAVHDEPKINPMTLEKALGNYRREAEIIFAYETANRRMD